jgi:hypothetical protein
MAVIKSSQKQLNLNQGIKTNVEIVDNKLQLIVLDTLNGENIYASSGTIEFPTIDLSQYFRQITSVSANA